MVATIYRLAKRRALQRPRPQIVGEVDECRVLPFRQRPGTEAANRCCRALEISFQQFYRPPPINFLEALVRANEMAEANREAARWAAIWTCRKTLEFLDELDG